MQPGKQKKMKFKKRAAFPPIKGIKRNVDDRGPAGNPQNWEKFRISWEKFRIIWEKSRLSWEIIRLNWENMGS